MVRRGGREGEGAEEVRRGWPGAGARVRVFNSVLQLGQARGDEKGGTGLWRGFGGAPWPLR